MNKRDEGLDRLRAINPVDETSVDGPDSPRAEELLTRITATPRDTHEHTRPGRKQLRLAITVAAAALATIAAVWVWTQAVERPTAISCYQAVDLDADIAAMRRDRIVMQWCMGDSTSALWLVSSRLGRGLPPLNPMTTAVRHLLQSSVKLKRARHQSNVGHKRTVRFLEDNSAETGATHARIGLGGPKLTSRTFNCQPEWSEKAPNA